MASASVRRGIDLAAALAGSGALVTLTARSASETEPAPKALRAAAGDAVAALLGVSDLAAVSAFFNAWPALTRS